MIHFMYTIT